MLASWLGVAALVARQVFPWSPRHDLLPSLPFPYETRFPVLLYDDTAGAALHTAAEEARRSGTPGYQTPHVLLGLLGTGDPVTRRVTDRFPQLTTEVVRQRLSTAARAPGERPARAEQRSRPAREPAAEFRQALSRFTAKWRPLVRTGQLRPGPKLGSGELWLAVLEPGTRSGELLRSLGTDPDEIRTVVLATMAPDPHRVPTWPTEVPPGPVSRLLARLVGRHA